MLPDESQVSAIVCALDAATTTIPRQLAALTAQENASAFEVVIADNGSTDATVLGELLWVRFRCLGGARSFMQLPSELSEVG